MKKQTKDLLLMSKDTVVMRINLTEGIYEVYNAALLPWSLKGRIKKVPDFSEIKTRYDDIQRQVILHDNYDAVLSWLSNRVLLLSRANAKWLYNAVKVEQLQTDKEKAKIALICNSVSINDSYWIKLEDDPSCWANIDIRKNSLNEIIAQIALHGKSLTIQGSLCLRRNQNFRLSNVAKQGFGDITYMWYNNFMAQYLCSKCCLLLLLRHKFRQ